MVERDVVVVVMADENVVVLTFGRSLIRKEQIKKNFTMMLSLINLMMYLSFLNRKENIEFRKKI
jgi:hypothetical protein